MQDSLNGGQSNSTPTNTLTPTGIPERNSTINSNQSTIIQPKGYQQAKTTVAGHGVIHYNRPLSMSYKEGGGGGGA